MSALFGVELRRLLARRLFRLTTLLVVAMFVVGGVIVFFASKTSPAEFEQAASEREAVFESCINSQGFGVPSEEIEDLERFCREETAAISADPRFDYGEMTDNLTGLAFPLLMLGWLLGASFIGAEWHNRMLTMTLTWEPRRTRVLLAKAGALALVVAVWILVLEVLYAAALYPAAAVNGITDSVDTAFWREMASIALRVDAMSVIAALLGFSLATIGRNTAAALGAGFAYLAVIEGLIRGFKPVWSRWLIGDNVGLFLVGELNTMPGRSRADAMALLLAYAAGFLALAVGFFRQREMT